jgi:hypothetical protein
MKQNTGWQVAGGIAAGTMVLALVACGGAKQTTKADVDGQPWEVRVESPLDTMTVTTYGGEQVVETTSTSDPDSPETNTVSTMTVESPTVTESRPTETVPDPDVFTPGWRVQIFASTSMVSADDVAAGARSRFTERVYVEYEPPMYKVRVGDFLTKREAEIMRTRVLAEDFDAWVVEALVVRPNR